MSFKGHRGAAPRSIRTIAEDKGSVASGLEGGLAYSAETGTVVGPMQPSPQAYHDVAEAALAPASAAVKPITPNEKSPFGK